MKLLIASDIHGAATWCARLMEAIDTHQPDRVILLGDQLYHGPRNDPPEDYAPKQVISMLNGIADRVLAVRGNCEAEVDQMVLDFPCMADYALMADPATSRDLFFTHGHVYGAGKHNSVDRLPALRDGDALVYGHTHIKVNEQGHGASGCSTREAWVSPRTGRTAMACMRTASSRTSCSRASGWRMATLWETIDGGADEVREHSFFGEDLSCANLGHVEFEDCSFDGCSFAELRAARISFDRCTFESCDFSNARMATSYWRDCQLSGSRLVGCDLHHSYFVRDTLRDCVCAYLNLTESKLEQVRFGSCDLHEASLAQLKLKRTTLEDCNLTRVELFGTRLRGIDLSTCEIQALRVSDSFAELRGARIGIDQAPDLMGLLGIKLV